MKQKSSSSKTLYIGDMIYCIGQDNAIRCYSIMNKSLMVTLRGYQDKIKYIYREQWYDLASLIITETNNVHIYIHESINGMLLHIITSSNHSKKYKFNNNIYNPFSQTGILYKRRLMQLKIKAGRKKLLSSLVSTSSSNNNNAVVNKKKN